MMNSETNIREEFARLEDDWESASRYLSIFIDESQQTIDELTDALLAVEASGGREGIDQLFIAAHRIKGSAASIGLNRVARLAHLMEDLLQIVVDGGHAITPKLADGMLACTDGLREYVDELKTGRPSGENFASLALRLPDAKSIVASSAEADTGSSPEQELADAVEEVLAETAAASEGSVPQETPRERRRRGIHPDLHPRIAALTRDEEHETALVGQVAFEPDLPLVGLKARLVYSKLSNLGTIRFFEPAAAELETIEELDSLFFGVVTDRSIEDIKRVLQVAGVQEILVERLIVEKSRAKTAAPAAPSTGKAGAADTTARPIETLRVDIERLDRLMNLAGQLAIGKARVGQIAENLKRSVGAGHTIHMLDRISVDLKKIGAGSAVDADVVESAELEEVRSTARRLQSQLETVQHEMRSFAEARACVNDLFETSDLLDSVSDGIRRSVMDMRMLPIGPLFTRFHRVIRDITRANGKDIRLLVSGEKTELDKRMIDELGDPMIHMVRNAADHGIEPPEVRLAAGKPRQGTVSLDAFHRGSNMVIRVSDDGKGLDPNRIRAKAVEKGLIAPADAEAMTRQQIFQLIWLPGLSTAEKVTDVSGRGVGMDIVRSKINELSGMIDVESELGRGTTFTIKLPLTLAVLPSLMVEIDGDVFAIPLESVIEIVCIRRSDMKTVHGHWTVPIRDRVIGIASLSSIFRWQQRGQTRDASDDDATTMVIIGEEDRQVGLTVDRVRGEEDVVIKSIAENYRNVAGIAGASILGDGRISLILDPATLIEMSSHPAAVAAAT